MRRATATRKRTRQEYGPDAHRVRAARVRRRSLRQGRTISSDHSIFLRCWIIMKVSKVYSVIWNHRYWSARYAFCAS